MEHEQEAYIRIELDGNFVEEYLLNKPVLTIGRQLTCDILIPSPMVSRLHARVLQEDGKWVIEDADSVNGVMYDGSRVKKCIFSNGDRVYLAPTAVLCYQEADLEFLMDETCHLEVLSAPTTELGDEDIAVDAAQECNTTEIGEEEVAADPAVEGDAWVLTAKPTFQAEFWATQKSRLIAGKISLLAYDPYPDNRVKKAITGPIEDLCVLRVGNYWVFYTICRPFVRLLALRPRQAFTSPDGFPSPDEITELLGDPLIDISWQEVLRPSAPPKHQPLPRSLAADYLASLGIPVQYHSNLLRMRTQDELLNCSGVPAEYVERLKAILFPEPLSRVNQEANYETDERLLTFLLQLSPQQKKVAVWAKASGPSLIRGKPGTGKSTVVLYRIRSFVEQQKEAGLATPRVLFTTYTNTLVETSKQLLAHLPGTHIGCIETSTADALIAKLFTERSQRATEGTLSVLFSRVLPQVLPDDTERQTFLSKHSEEYLLEEINQLIIARKISTEAEYLSLKRTGRKVALQKAQRSVIWRLYELFLNALREFGQETWSQWRVRAEEHLLQEQHNPVYDAVVVDEAQDLEPCVLRILLMLCKTPSHFVITADANQSIYNPNFRWADAHETLEIRGRTTVLKTNYRSTRQIGEATETYLRSGAGEMDRVEWTHENVGSLPAMRRTADAAEEVKLLVNFLNKSTRKLGMGLQSCAVFCPTNRKAELLAQELKKQGIDALFQSGRNINLSAPGVKVLTLHSSKGLEFPIVALAGFRDTVFTRTWEHVSDGEREEKLAQQRRVLFVGMTRAMRILLVLVPAEISSSLFTGFNATYWNVE